MDMRNMLFGEWFKLETSVKRFVKGVGKMSAIGILEHLERMEAKCIIKKKVTHILIIALLDREKVKEPVE